jgi:hypothetical protein
MTKLTYEERAGFPLCGGDGYANYIFRRRNVMNNLAKKNDQSAEIDVKLDLKKLAKMSPGLTEILDKIDAQPAKVKKDKGDFVRVQLDFPLSRIQELNQVMRDTDLETRKDLFNNALSLFAWAVGEKMKGNRLLSIDEEGSQKELVMIPLETAANKARRASGGSPPTETGDGGDGDFGGDEDDE